MPGCKQSLDIAFADYWLHILEADRQKVYDEFIAELECRPKGFQHIGNARAVLESFGRIEYLPQD